MWHPIERRLYWTDIPSGRLFPYAPKSTRLDRESANGPPLIAPLGALLLFMDRGTIALWRNGTFREIVPEIPDERAWRFNDVIGDPQGRVCGTMSTLREFFSRIGSTADSKGVNQFDPGSPDNS